MLLREIGNEARFSISAILAVLAFLAISCAFLCALRGGILACGEIPILAFRSPDVPITGSPDL